MTSVATTDSRLCARRCNRPFEGRIVFRSDETVAHELQPRLSQPRADDVFREDQNRNTYEETRIGGEVQQE